ncbi:MAG: hypothetical protein WEC35_03415 [Nitrosopumilaceae archaeon]
MKIPDTSFVVSYFNTRDQNHPKAVKLMKEIHEPLCLTDYIFGEVFDEDFGKIGGIKVIGA